jgi:uncharacterized YigZ family protein
MPVITDNSDFYLEINSPQECEIKIKGSRFIGHAFPVSNKEMSEEQINIIRKLHYNASHNCFSYIIGFDGNNFRYSDDGEPSGTAGKQIFQAINHFGYKNILVIVTRYFGGTKLGIGPLSRAYFDSAKEVLSLCEKKVIYKTTKFEIESDYTSISLLKHIFEDFSVNLTEEYLENVKFKIDVLNSQSTKFEELIIEKTNGKVNIRKLKIANK